MVLAHDAAESAAFNYANQAGLDLWETTWEEFVGMQSTGSAEDDPEVGLYHHGNFCCKLGSSLAACSLCHFVGHQRPKRP